MPAAVRTTITLLVAGSDAQAPVHEQVVVDSLGAGRYRLVSTPGLVMGTAAGDVVEINPDGSPAVVSRAGNVAVQLYASDAAADEVVAGFTALGGWLDGRIPDTLTVFTVPSSSGFVGIQALLEWLGRRHPDVEWVFGNVYEADGVTPLGWWDPDAEGGAGARP